MKLHEFLSQNQPELVAMCQQKVRQRSPGTHKRELAHGITPFLEQLIKTLQVEQQTTDPSPSEKVSGPAGGQVANSEIGETATEHGRELLRNGYSIEEVVHDYGDLCQSITELAFNNNVAIDTDEFRTLNRCLDNAIAVAVTEFAYQRDFMLHDTHSQDINQRLGFFAHELRNLVTTATLAVNIIKAGNVGLTGATGQVLDRSLRGLRNLIDSSLAEVRMSASSAVQVQLFSLSGFIAEAKLTGSLEAADKNCVFIVAAVDPALALSGDRDLLLAALGNLLQNAFKFTGRGTEVTLNAYVVGSSIHIDVEDNCGGLNPGDVDSMFIPHVQLGRNRSGVGLGLSICKRSVEANGGALTARDVSGRGCVFTIELPRHLVAPAAEEELVGVPLDQ